MITEKSNQPISGPVAVREISFIQEVYRKATHMGALVIPMGYYLLGLEKGQALAIMIPITIGMILLDIARLRDWSIWHNIFSKAFSRMIRSHEQAGDWTGATYILTSSCFTIGLYDKPIAIAALSFIIVGDSFAAVLGRRYGKHKFGRKSVEGSLACLAGTLIVAVLTPGLAWQVAVAGAVVATVVEALSAHIDDNVSVPILSGLAMTLIQKAFSLH